MVKDNNEIGTRSSQAMKFYAETTTTHSSMKEDRDGTDGLL
jgi:hypothetical protein